MSDHVIQIRDLMEMLKQHDPTAHIHCARGQEKMTIDRVQRGLGNTRAVSIGVNGDSVVSDLEEQCEELDSRLKKAIALLERFQHMQDAIGTPEELDEMAVKKLVDDVAAFL